MSGDGGRLQGRLAAWAGLTGALLLVPLAAMGLTDEVAWTASDFGFAGGLLLGAGLVYELTTLKRGLAWKAAVGGALAGVVLLIWAAGAVGLAGA